MAFINEYVSEEDIKEFQLDELWFKYNPGKKEVPSYFQHHWTVDKENDVYLKLAKTGREEHSNRITYIFKYESDLYEVVLDVVEGSSLSFSEQPYILLLELIRVAPKPEINGYEYFIDCLKKALMTYGDGGVLHQVPNTIVKFNNF